MARKTSSRRKVTTKHLKIGPANLDILEEEGENGSDDEVTRVENESVFNPNFA